MSTVKRTFLGLGGSALLAVWVAGCRHNAPNTAVHAAPPPASAPATPAPAAPNSAVSGGDAVLSEDLATLNSRGYLKDAFFDYDKSGLRSDARTALAEDARWLARYPSIRVLVEGHCDERGTEEYNLALGDRRDGAVREYLAEMGVSPSRMQTVSYGKDRPFCSDENEKCWQENRRGHFVITAK
jgi:peptidoglycan-associated lipoprotein